MLVSHIGGHFDIWGGRKPHDSQGTGSTATNNNNNNKANLYRGLSIGAIMRCCK